MLHLLFLLMQSQSAARDSSEPVGPLMPNVLKVYLENGQTKSFKYDSSTTVSDVLNSLQQKLGFKSIDHFSLCVEHVKSIRRNKLTLLDPAESLAWVCLQTLNLHKNSERTFFLHYRILTQIFPKARQKNTAPNFFTDQMIVNKKSFSP